MKPRTNVTQLPSTRELFEMMAREEQRPAMTNSTFPDFTSVMKWVDGCGIKTELFSGKPDCNFVLNEAERVRGVLVQMWRLFLAESP